ncbi:restriction endonuclease [Nonomuraea angiospora]|uniref:restriction endonuclease n=1 Tax=Nonomuraea angiospora TaxID=46172 RepID=UPI0029BA3FA4|nr:restriction endonuclease [Nonomuraea angiospora]MDX3099523.1 restriction endonuclease [Nonomuraea angiospora]
MALVGAGVVITFVAYFITRYPGWAMAITIVLIAALSGGLFLRHRAIQARRLQFLAANAALEKVDLMTGPQFEQLVAERMIAQGFRRVRIRGGAGDGGVDITAVAPDGTRCAVQCKRYNKSVGAPAVRNFLGALANAFTGHTGVLITSGRLTRPAREEATNARQRLLLVDRDLLADWLTGRLALLAKPAPLVEGDEPAT